ncbi:MAG TPA: vitamin K epoxide reductase family protein [Patescibacteria group bacterium]|nr:vitamin K epoxide reductase family protein [Patescibacteria group bacterium]
MNLAKNPRHNLTWQRALPYVLLTAGLVGLTASFFLTLDKINLLQNTTFKPACDLNPIISCGAVMKSNQANTFGVPNSVFGLIAFSALTVLGVAVLAGATFKRWFWLAAQVAATAGILAMHYLFFEDVFRIHAICPWCFSVWMVTIPTYFGITIYNIRAGNLGTARVVKAISKYSNDILVLWYLIIFAVLLIRFWYYWKTLL